MTRSKGWTWRDDVVEVGGLVALALVVGAGVWALVSVLGVAGGMAGAG